MNRDDFVADLMGLVRLAGLEADAADRLEVQIRARWADQAVRIRAVRPVTLDDINAALRQRKPVREIADELGMSRATIYRRLNVRRRG